MYTQQNFIDSFLNDIRIIKHLATKIKPEDMEYRPSSNQRSMLELLQYIGMVGEAALKTIYKNDTGIFKEHVEASKSITLENFIETMERQERAMVAIMEDFTDEEVMRVINIYGMGEKTKGVYLVETIHKWYPAYKMQLFLYLKACGNTALSTSNLWGGFDAPVN